MIHIENIEVIGWEAAVRGMRNPMNSWDKSDSGWDWVEDPSPINPNDPGMMFVIGENDLDLMKRLAQGGGVHAKYRRMLVVTCDITAPLYWWKEYDTYKVGTVANSCSTMHKIHDKEFTVDDFSFEQMADENKMLPAICSLMLYELNEARMLFLATKDKKHWWKMIQLLPSSYNQRRTVQFSYENGASMHKDRHNHKLDEWHGFCDMLESLPYADGIIYNIGACEHGTQ